MPTTPLLEVEGVSRSFERSAGVRWAVKDVTLALSAGEIVTLLGPNGAGKTTLMKMISTLLEPTAGDIRVSGIDVVRNPSKAKSNLALVLGGDRGFFMRASAAENLRYFASLAGVPHRKRGDRIEELLTAVSLFDRRNEKVETFSRGMKQRLHLARGLLAAPPLVLLDEPTIGLDPESAQALRHLVRNLGNDGKGVLLTTHYLHEAEELSDRSLVIIDGRIAVEGRAADIAAAGNLGQVTVLTANVFPGGTVARLRTLPAARHVRLETVHGRMLLTVGWEAGEPNLAALSEVVSSMQIESLVTRPATLEEGYLALVDVNPAEAHRDG